MTVTAKLIREKLKAVIDPEVGLNIVDMGLVYKVDFDAGLARIEMTLTTPGCPMQDYMTNEVNRVMAELAEVKDVQLDVVWEPPWSPDMINREVINES